MRNSFLPWTLLSVSVIGVFFVLNSAILSTYSVDNTAAVLPSVVPCTLGVKYNTLTGALCPTTPVVALYTFTKVLLPGSTGSDVKALQQLLNTEGFSVAKTGAGSPGKESTYYGPATALAVGKFQLAYKATILTPLGLTKATGIVGAGTLKQLNIIELALAQKSSTFAITTPGAPNTGGTVVTQTVVGGSTGGSNSSSGSSGSSGGSSGGTTPPPVVSTPGTILIPGSGFSGPTSQPATVGSGPGSDAEAIARWDVVPYQTFSGNFNVGVVAFHINSIDHVAFSVNGGAWTNVSQMTLNTQTADTDGIGDPSSGVVEYWATLQASNFADGPVTVRAIAYPTVGVPRVLDDLTLYANSGGAENPQTYYISPTGSDSTGKGTLAAPWQSMLQATMAGAAGSVVYMEPGTYHFSQRIVGFRTDSPVMWQTFEPAPGVSRNQVIVSTQTTDSMRSGHTLLNNVRVDMTSGTSFFGFSGIWVNDCELFGNRTVGFGVSPLSSDQTASIYVTNSEFHDISAASVINGATLIRNYKIYNSLAHGINNPLLAVNGIMDNITTSDDPTIWGTPQEGHDDGISWGFAGDGNSITYGLTITRLFDSLGFISYYGFSNLALVNVNITTTGTGPGGQSQFDRQNSGNYSHVYLNNVVLNDQSIVFDDRNGQSSQWNDVLVKNSKALSYLLPNIVPNQIQLQGDTLANGNAVPNQNGLTPPATMPSTPSTPSNPTPSNPAPASPASSNLVLEYPFDGTTNDTSTSGNNGTMTGTPSYGTGEFGQALSFGGGDFVQTSQNVPTTGSFTLSAWINGSDYSTAYNLYTFLSGTSQLTSLAVYNNTLYMTVNGTNHFGHISLSAGQWYHVVGVYNSSTQTIQTYVNGVQDLNEADTSGGSISQPYRIGARGDRTDAYYFSGNVDDVRIYNTALTSSQVQALYGGTLSINTSNNQNFLAGVWTGFENFIHALVGLF